MPPALIPGIIGAVAAVGSGVASAVGAAKAGSSNDKMIQDQFKNANAIKDQINQGPQAGASATGIPGLGLSPTTSPSIGLGTPSSLNPNKGMSTGGFGLSGSKLGKLSGASF